MAPAPSSTTESAGRTPDRRAAWMPTASGWASAADSRLQPSGISTQVAAGAPTYVASPPSALSPRVK